MNRIPVGDATAVGWDEDGVAVWRLTVHRAERPGRRVVVDREFHPL